MAYVFNLQLNSMNLFAERFFLSAGEYPTTFSEVIPNFYVQGMFTPGNRKGTYVEGGNPMGLYRLVLGVGQNVFSANGEYSILSHRLIYTALMGFTL
jgi:hypothetical protein